MTKRTLRRRPGLLERLASGPVICAEGYLFELERRGYLQAGAYVPEAVRIRVDEIPVKLPHHVRMLDPTWSRRSLTTPIARNFGSSAKRTATCPRSRSSQR